MNELKKILAGTLILFSLAAGSALDAQVAVKDSIGKQSREFRLSRQVAPATLILAGFAVTGHPAKEKLQDMFPRTNTRVDNYLQWSPGFVMYTADIFGVKHKNNAFNQTKYLIISQLATSGIVQLLKYTTNVTRPNGGTHSFPSGHTSNAFAGATVLFHEYSESCLPVAISGYVLSSATGVLRVTNNRHWVPDVLVGAGIGIIVTNLVYYIEPLKNWDPFKLSAKRNITLLPSIDAGNNSYMFTVIVKMK